jgi:predicted nucleotidyltransferase component of viral defense system
MHRFSEVFEEHAVLTGGMALRLMNCPRRTVDIDYVFVPFSSKKEIVDRVKDVFDDIDGARVDSRFHSKMLRIDLRVDDAAIQVEVNPAESCASIPMTTGELAHAVGVPAQVVRVMDPSSALAHKLATWNERRLWRDLYDCAFLYDRVGAKPELAVLDGRLSRIESRLPVLKNRRTMTRAELASDLSRAVGDLTDSDLETEIGGLLSSEELVGLSIRIRVAAEGLVAFLTSG